MKRITGAIVGLAVSLILLLGSAVADPSREGLAPAYKGLRAQKPPIDPDSIPDPFLSYLVRRGQQAALKEKEEEERLRIAKAEAAEKLRELLTPRTDLQKVALSQLTLTAIVEAEGMTWALVREPTKGRGFVLKRGTRIGTNGGMVDRISRSERKIIIKEPYLEDELHLKFKDVEMKLPDQVYEAKQ